MLDGPVHYLDFGALVPRSGDRAVHGLGGSAVNWSAIAPLLDQPLPVRSPRIWPDSA